MSNTSENQLTQIKWLTQATDRCVKCGMCLQACPTYLATQNEAESPRGRISLIQSMVKNELAYSQSLTAHLESCLQCRACEDICPSDVTYGAIIDQGLALTDKQKISTPLQRISKKTGLAIIKSPAYLSQFLGLVSIAQFPGFNLITGLLLSLFNSPLASFFKRLPNIRTFSYHKTYYAATNNHRGDVALFTGCIAKTFDSLTLEATINVLNKLGYGVHIPLGQGCCGALHQHNAQPQAAKELETKNIAAFDNLNIDAIISTASGCGSMLKEYENKPTSDTQKNFTDRVVDISQFLMSIDWPDNITLTELNKTIAIHDPCSLRRVLHQHNEPHQLLKKIAATTIIPLPDNDQCCGAAGSYMLTHPEMANKLRDSKLQQIDNTSIDYLATSNIGCALHFKQGLNNHSQMEVIHPVVLIDRQLAVLEQT